MKGKHVFMQRALFAAERHMVARRLALGGFDIPRGFALTEGHIYKVAERVKKVMR
jgi:hypothetical protein